MMKFPDDFVHITYDLTDVQETIERYIAEINASEGAIEEISTGNIVVTKIGDIFRVEVRSDCWIPMTQLNS